MLSTPSDPRMYLKERSLQAFPETGGIMGGAIAAGSRVPKGARRTDLCQEGRDIHTQGPRRNDHRAAESLCGRFRNFVRLHMGLGFGIFAVRDDCHGIGTG